MPEFDYVIGTFGGIEEKPSGGWKTVKVMRPGKDYPLKMDTKKDELIDQARAIGAGEVATWKFSESDSGTPNPNRPGSNYINRRFEAVKVGTHIPEGYSYEPLQTGSGGGGDGGSRSSSGDPERKLSKEEWRAKDSAADMRACIAIAAGALQHTVPSSPSTDELNEFNARVLHLATAWHRVVSKERDREPLPSEGGAEPPPDDDVPF